MSQAKHIETGTVRNSDTIGELSLLLKVARRLAIRTGDRKLVSCTELALHLLDQQSGSAKSHQGPSEWSN